MGPAGWAGEGRKGAVGRCMGRGVIEEWSFLCSCLLSCCELGVEISNYDISGESEKTLMIPKLFLFQLPGFVHLF